MTTLANWGDSPLPPPRRKVFSSVGARRPYGYPDLKGATRFCGLSDSFFGATARLRALAKRLYQTAQGAKVSHCTVGCRAFSQKFAPHAGNRFPAWGANS